MGKSDLLVSTTLHTAYHLADPLWTDPPGQTLGRQRGWWGGIGWGGGVGGGCGCGPLALQVWLSTVEETCCSVTVMNDFAYPLIIAHSGAERGPLIKMSWGTAGLLHLWQTPSMPQQPQGRPGGIGFKESGRSGCCHSAMTVTASTWRLQSNLLSGADAGGRGEGSPLTVKWNSLSASSWSELHCAPMGLSHRRKEKNTDRRKEKKGRAACYDKLRKCSESKGLRLILAVMQQYGLVCSGVVTKRLCSIRTKKEQQMQSDHIVSRAKSIRSR